MLLESSDNCKIKMFKNNYLTGSETGQLTGTNWISFSMIDHFCSYLDTLRPGCHFTSLQRLPLTDYSALNELVYNWSKRHIKTICIIINVRSEESNVYTSYKSRKLGNHWSCFTIYLKERAMVYGDSLGWAFPKDLSGLLKTLFRSINLIYKFERLSPVILGHNDQPKSDKCTAKCIKDFPFQGKNYNICGVAALLTALMLTDKSCFASINKERTVPSYFSWIGDLQRYVDFARGVMVTWLMEQSIDDSYIKQEEVFIHFV